MVKMAAEGASLAKIASQFGIGTTSAAKILRSNGGRPSRARLSFAATPEILKTVREMRESGEGYLKIGLAVGTTATTAKALCLRMGLNIGNRSGEPTPRLTSPDGEALASVITEMRAAGFACSAIGTALGMNGFNVARLCRVKNIPHPPKVMRQGRFSPTEKAALDAADEYIERLASEMVARGDFPWTPFNVEPAWLLASFRGVKRGITPNGASDLSADSTIRRG